MVEQTAISGADRLDAATLRQSEYGGTPLQLIRQVFEELRWLGVRPSTFLEPGSGPAPFCKVADLVWPGVNTVAVETRWDEVEPAQKNASAFVCDTVESYLELSGAKFDLAGGNPPFTLAIPWAQLCLKHARDVLFLLPSDWHCKSEAACDAFEESGLEEAICHQYLIPGRVAMYGGSGTDRITYSWFHMTNRSGFRGEGWRTTRLPRLPSNQRRWAVRPGTES